MDVSALSREAGASIATLVPEGASARIVALPFGRFRLRVREGRLAVSVGKADVRIEAGQLHVRALRPPGWAVALGCAAPLGLVPAAILLVVGPLYPGLVAAALAAIVITALALVRSLLAVPEETTVHAADAFVVGVRRPLGLGRLDRPFSRLERFLPRPLSDLVGRRVVEVEASFGSDRLAIRRRALAATRVATAQSFVQTLNAARHTRRAV
jgi:hypothetical protein